MMIATAYSIRAPARLLPPDPLRPRDRAGGIVADGPRPAGAAPRARVAVLAPAGHGPRRDDDPQRRPPAVGDVRGVGRRGRPRRLPRGVAGGRPVARAGGGDVLREARSAPRPRRVGRRQPAGGRRGAELPIARAGGDPHAGPDSPWQPRRVLPGDRASGRRPRRPAGAARLRRDGGVARRAPGHLLPLALLRRRARVRLRPRGPSRGRAAHAGGALVLRGAVRPLPPVRRAGHVGRGGPAQPRASLISRSSRAQNSRRAAASARWGPRWSEAAGSSTSVSPLRLAPARRASRRAGRVPTTRSRAPASTTSRVARGIRRGSISGSPNGTRSSRRPG